MEQKEQEAENLLEEHGGEDGLLAAAQNDKGKITQAALKTALKDDPAEEEKAVLQQYSALLDAQGSLKAQIKTQTAALHQKLYQKYAALTEAEIQTLLVEHNGTPPSAAASKPTARAPYSSLPTASPPLPNATRSPWANWNAKPHGWTASSKTISKHWDWKFKVA